MAMHRVDATATSPGRMNSAVIHLESETRVLRGTFQRRSTSLDVDIVGDLDIIFFINAFFGTDWILTITVDGVAKPPITGTTDTKNKSLVVMSLSV
jgi:hypothetical protein